MSDNERIDYRKEILIGDYDFCKSDKEEVLSMKLSEIGIEFDLPNWLLVRAIETLVITYGIGCKKRYKDMRDKSS